MIKTHYITLHLPIVEIQIVTAFPSYLFVRNDTRDRNDVFQARGVMYYVRHDNRDATLSDAEMELLQNSGSLIVPATLQPLPKQRGELVKINVGLLAGYCGTLGNPAVENLTFWISKKY